MRIRNKLVFALAAAAALGLGAFAEESGGHGGGSAHPQPPQPRVIELFTNQPLPPRETDPSWMLYQEGVKLYGEKRLGESLDLLKKAVEKRSELFARCAADVDAALSAKEAKKAKDSLAMLLKLLAARDLIPQDLEAIRSKSGGSIVAEMRLLRETSPSTPLRGLVDAALLVVEERGVEGFGDSLAALRKEVENLGHYPEAEFMIGKIYLAEGEQRLAELQFLRACDMGESLEVPDERYAMLAALADIYKTNGDMKSYETTLRDVSDSSDLFSAKDDYYRDSMERTLGERGIDKFMLMYRVDQIYPIHAYAALGKMYLGDGRRIATIYLAAATNAILTRSIAEIRIDEPGYEYAGLRDILARISSDPEMAEFASGLDLWQDLLLLGKALARSGYRESAREIWSAMKAADTPQPLKRRAAEALSQPVSASLSP